MLIAFLVGLLFGFVGSIPVAGPIAILVFGRGLQNRSRSGIYLALGSAVAESAYAYFAFWGFSALEEKYPWMQQGSFGVAALVLIALGLRFATTRSKPDAEVVAPPSNVGNKRSFLLGITITALNPTLIVTWTAAVATLRSLHWVSRDVTHALPFSIGVWAGIIAWFSVLLTLLARFKGRFHTSTLDRVVRVMGVVLVGFGLWFAVRFVMEFQAPS
jgi:threonine/homoserine/homoserine lactone efflux protein